MEGQRPEASRGACLLPHWLCVGLAGPCPPGSGEDVGTNDNVSRGSLSAFTGPFLFGGSWYGLGTR